MHTYRVSFLNNRSNLVGVIMEMQRPFMTKRDFEMIYAELFFTACTEGIDAASQTAIIERDGVPCMEIEAESVQDGAIVDCYLSARGEIIRRMNIAS